MKNLRFLIHILMLLALTTLLAPSLWAKKLIYNWDSPQCQNPMPRAECFQAPPKVVKAWNQVLQQWQSLYSESQRNPANVQTSFPGIYMNANLGFPTSGVYGAGGYGFGGYGGYGNLGLGYGGYGSPWGGGYGLGGGYGTMGWNPGGYGQYPGMTYTPGWGGYGGGYGMGGPNAFAPYPYAVDPFSQVGAPNFYYDMFKAQAMGQVGYFAGHALGSWLRGRSSGGGGGGDDDDDDSGCGSTCKDEDKGDDRSWEKDKGRKGDKAAQLPPIEPTPAPAPTRPPCTTKPEACPPERPPVSGGGGAPVQNGPTSPKGNVLPPAKSQIPVGNKKTIPAPRKETSPADSATEATADCNGGNCNTDLKTDSGDKIPIGNYEECSDPNKPDILKDLSEGPHTSPDEVMKPVITSTIGRCILNSMHSAPVSNPVEHETYSRCERTTPHTTKTKPQFTNRDGKVISGKGTNVTEYDYILKPIRYRPCITKQYHFRVTQSYKEAMACLGLKDTEFFSSINVESRFHINRINARDASSGIAQIVPQYAYQDIIDKNKQYIDLAKQLKKTNRSCTLSETTILKLLNQGELEKRNSRCGLTHHNMDNPLRSFYLGGLYYIKAGQLIESRYLKFSSFKVKAHDGRNEYSCKLPKPIRTNETLIKRMKRLVYNMGAHGVMAAVCDYYTDLVTKHGNEKALKEFNPDLFDDRDPNGLIQVTKNRSVKTYLNQSRRPLKNATTTGVDCSGYTKL